MLQVLSRINHSAAVDAAKQHLPLLLQAIRATCDGKTPKTSSTYPMRVRGSAPWSCCNGSVVCLSPGDRMLGRTVHVCMGMGVVVATWYTGNRMLSLTVTRRQPLQA
jgi:hypothetical protein